MSDLELEQITKRENSLKDLSVREILSFLDEIDFFNEYSRYILNRISAEDIIDYACDLHTQKAYELEKLFKEKEIAVIRAEEREKFCRKERQKLHEEYLEKIKLLEGE